MHDCGAAEGEAIGRANAAAIINEVVKKTNFFLIIFYPL